MITIRQSVREDAFVLGPDLRPEDASEVMAAGGKFPTEALLTGLEVSDECYTMTAGGKVLCMFGIVQEKNPSIGRIWMLGSSHIHSHKFEFLRISKEWVASFQESYPILYNFIDARNTVHIRWLNWLGFTFISEHPDYGFERRLFYQFIRTQNNV